MKILIDINHPAHVHLFRNLIQELHLHHIHTVVTASRKDIAFELLKIYKIDFIDLGTYGSTPLQKALNVPVMAMKMLKVVQKQKPDVLLGLASSRITHAGFFTGIPSYVFTDTEHAKEQIMLFRPFATKIFTPDCFTADLGKKHVRYPSYHELAYLHPNRFTPNLDLLRPYGISENEKFFVVRFVSWNASHDIGQKGLTNDQKIHLVNLLSSIGKVIISSEGVLPENLQQYQMKIPLHLMHHLLYYAQAYIGEGGTMATEAAVLGTPSVFISTLTAGTFQELQNKFSLLFCFDNYEKSKNTIEYLVTTPGIKNEWQQRRRTLLNSKIDASQYMLEECLHLKSN
jgi:predicted glycosyltransferase